MGFNLEKKSISSLDGDIFYVDDDFNESTPGWNVTHFAIIRDALNVVSDGDTVFVYNGGYSENLTIKKSISLIGENKYTTIIDGINGTELVTKVSIDADEVTFCGFTIRRGGINGFGIDISSKYNVVTDNIVGPYHERLAIVVEEGNNIISNNTIINSEGMFVFGNNNIILNNTFIVNSYIEGLYISGENNLVCRNTIQKKEGDGINIGGFGRNTITQNIISNCGDDGICISQSSMNTITSNIISNNGGYGIFMSKWSYSNNISKNIITNNTWGGIDTSECTSVYGNIITNNDIGINAWGNHSMITMNAIENNTIGIQAVSNKGNHISMNNFMNNKVNARYRYKISHVLFRDNVWNANFWNIPHQTPVPIRGRIGVLIFRIIPWFPQYDKHPAQEPYDIEV
jgi:parallel beta-helix repeat protein